MRQYIPLGVGAVTLAAVFSRSAPGPTGAVHEHANTPPAASAADWFRQAALRVTHDMADVEEADGALWQRHSGSELGVSLHEDGRAELSHEGTVVSMRTVSLRQGGADVALGVGELTAGPCSRGPAREGCVRSAEVDQGPVTSWWRHAPDGLEQGWTVDEPLGDGPLTLELEVRGGTPGLTDGRMAIGDGLVASTVVAVDDGGAVLPVEVALTGDGFEITVDVDGADFPVAIDPVWRPWTWTRSGPTPSAGFGTAVALDGDVNGDGFADALVGAPGYGRSRAQVGRVYLYLGGPTGLPSQPAITWTGTDARQRLGSGVAFLGDVNGDGYEDLALGSPGLSRGKNKQGAVHVYLGTAGGPSTTAAFELLGDRAERQLGGTLTRVGDVNGDGYDDLLAGIYGDRAGPTGAATWFPGGPSMTTASHVTLSRHTEFYGVLVAGLGDIDQDGYADLLVGDPAERGRNNADLYRGGPGGPPATPARSWTASGVGGATAGDFNGDGWPDLALSTWSGVSWYAGSIAGLPATATGVVPSTEWSEVRPLAAGDMTGDGYDDLLLGNPGHEGSLRLLVGSSSGLLDDGERLLRIGGGSFDLGAALSMGDVDGDGMVDALAGAPDADPPDTGIPARPTQQTWRRGNAFLFHGGPNPLGVVPPMVSFYGNDIDAIIALGDVTGDGISDLVLDAGSATDVFFGDPAGFPATASQHVPAPTPSGWGSSGITTCDINGDGLSEVFQADPGTTADRVRVYEGGPAGLDPTPTEVTLSGSPSIGSIRLKCAGDTDGDGDEELMVLVSNSQYWWVDLYPGTPTGLSGTRRRLGAPTCWSCDSHYTTDAVGRLDVNGDGLGDVVGVIERNRALVWLGRTTGPEIEPDQILPIPSAMVTLGYRIATGGDVNGDGYDDVLLADDDARSDGRWGTVYVLPGGAAGLGTALLGRLESREADSTLEGGALAIVPDLNGDGYDDIVLGAMPTQSSDQPYQSLAWVYAGGPTGVSAIPTYTAPWGHAASAALAAGDLDGDGRGEVVLVSGLPVGTGKDRALWLLGWDGGGLAITP